MFQNPVKATMEGAQVSVERIDGEVVTVIEGEGNVPFRIERGDSENRYTITQSYYENGRFILFGYVELSGTTAFYDGYALIVNEMGGIELETIIERNHLSEVKALKVNDNEVYGLIDQHLHIEDTLDFKSSLIMKLEETSEVLYESETQIQRFKVEAGALFMSGEYFGPYERALMNDGTLLKTGETHGIEKGGQYAGEVTFYTLCSDANIDGTPIEDVHKETYPGHYVFTCQDQKHSFTVNPTIEGVTLFEETEAPLSISVSGGRVWLNDDLYSSEDLIDMPGYHTLRVEGANGYELRRSFTLTSGLSGIENGEVYKEPRTLYFSGVGTLNGSPIQPGHVIDESGSYDLLINGHDTYEEAYEFEIDFEDEATEFEEVRLEVGLVAGAFLFTGGGFLIYKKRK